MTVTDMGFELLVTAPPRLATIGLPMTDEARRIWMTDEADEAVLDAEISRE